MSRIGKQPIKLPPNIIVSIEQQTVTVAGPLGSLSQAILQGLQVKQVDDQIIVSRIDDLDTYKANHGLMRTLIDNMVIGVSQGFNKKLEVVGVGYRVNLTNEGLKFSLGYSHDIDFKLPTSIKASVEQNNIVISGIDKQQVGQIASEIRALRKPEPYKGKGIRYSGEYILRKSGKSGKDK